MLLVALAFSGFREILAGDVGQRRVLQYFVCRVAHFEKYLVQSAMLDVAINEATQLLSIPKRRQGAINQADDLTETNLRRWTAQLVSTFSAAHAFHDAGVFQLEQNEFQELFGKNFFISNVADADGSLVV